MLSLKRFRKTNLLLLLAFMAMLPLQGVQAALDSFGHHRGDAHSPADHLEQVMIDATGMHSCQMHDHERSGQDGPASQHCSSSGCDMCGTCSTTPPSPFTFAVIKARFLPEPAERQHSFSNDPSPLYRPPKA